MLLRICAGSPKAMQQVDIVQSRMSLRCSRGKCNYVLTPSCAHSLLEKKVNIIFFYFQPLVYVHNQMYKCRLLITFENSSGPTKCSRENACMCRLVSAFAAREKMFCFFISAHFCPLSSATSVVSWQPFQTAWTEGRPGKTFLRKWRAYEVPHEPSLLERKVFLSAHFCFLLDPFFPQSSIQFCWKSCFSSVCSCENAHMSLIYFLFYLSSLLERIFFIHFWVELPCTQDEFLHDVHIFQTVFHL